MTKFSNRCKWCLNDSLNIDYHDKVWGVPEFRSEKLWEKLVLETFQAGLSWIIILRKKENFRLALDNFSAKKISLYGEEKIDSLMSNPKIVRNKRKINAIINNSKIYLKIDSKVGFNNYLWNFVDFKPIDNRLYNEKDINSFSGLSKTISSDMKKKGFSFCGPVIIYSLMQACGIVNDHVVTCPRYKEILKISI